ncbi:hypothetical protein [Polyangium sp. y55x31]|uniref:hypothetical protein n=1 Tax=Polyangium sp. y55x31 TaxID=3042688 RepID=UPI002482A5FE|nr:hypothetical protein [Polyangium sp. y55x31]MDI1478452.1 hypothetical protein [Polyangium sp. y55x31]
MLRRLLFPIAGIGLSLFTIACGGGAQTTPPQTAADAEANPDTNPEAPKKSAKRPPPMDPSLGRDKEHPVPRCGPVDSYAFVSEYTCKDGSQPLGADPRKGQQARSGNVGANHTGHIIDRYVVECPDGEVEIFVDMYGCPAAEERLDQMREAENPFGPPGEALPRPRLLAIAAVFKKMSQAPLSEASREHLGNAVEWASESPDIDVRLCPWFRDYIDGPNAKSHSGPATILLGYTILGVAAHLIENPRADSTTAQVEGLRMAIRVYRQMRDDGAFRPVPVLEQLDKVESEGKLAGWFAKNTNCSP